MVLPPRLSGKTSLPGGVSWGPTWSDCQGGREELLLFFLLLNTSQQALRIGANWVHFAYSLDAQMKEPTLMDAALVFKAVPAGRPTFSSLEQAGQENPFAYTLG